MNELFDRVNQVDEIYAGLLKDVMQNGRDREDRTGTGTRSVFGRQVRFDLREGFPLLTTKKINFQNVWTELLWFLKGDTNIAFLKEHNNPIWNQWCNENGDLGPVYGAQWRSWADNDGQTIDQIENLIEGLRNNPFSRRHIVTGWNPSDLPIEGVSHADNVNAGRQALPPCHTMFQFYVTELTTSDRAHYAMKNRSSEESDYVAKILSEGGDKPRLDAILDNMEVPRLGLSCQLYQRSADLFLGVPYNIASYALLTHIVAEMTDMMPLEFVHTFGDLHLYQNHFAQVAEQLFREPKLPPAIDLTTWVRGYYSVDELQLGDVRLLGYDPHPFISAKVAV